MRRKGNGQQRQRGYGNAQMEMRSKGNGLRSIAVAMDAMRSMAAAMDSNGSHEQRQLHGMESQQKRNAKEFDAKEKPSYDYHSKGIALPIIAKNESRWPVGTRSAANGNV